MRATEADDAHELSLIGPSLPIGAGTSCPSGGRERGVSRGGVRMGGTRAVDRVLAGAVAAGDVPGVVALVADARGVAYTGAYGEREIGHPAAMTPDTVVWIASMTKPVTSVAALQLVERGRVGLDDPAAEVLPELGAVRVLDGFDPAGVPRLRPPRRPITPRHLLTHTAGFGSAVFNPDVARYQSWAGLPPAGHGQHATLLRTPLLHDPGERWEYGTSTDWLGRLVEAASGQGLEAYLREHVCGPLGMADTGFRLRPDQRARLATVHHRQPDGSLQPTAFEMPQEPEYVLGSGGLYSTGPDYLRFLRMLLGGGELDGARILRPETVAALAANQIGEISVGPLASANPALANDVEFFPRLAKRWGFAAMVTTEDAPTGRAAGSLAWAGLANTSFWVDPSRRLAGVLLTQVLPFADARVLALADAFERAVYDRPSHGAGSRALPHP